jgi:uncharacterized YccA/Bax inhibitor family protein
MLGSPVLSDNVFKREAGQGAGWQAPGAGQPGVQAADRPKVMTIGGTMTATAVLFILMLITAYLGWVNTNLATASPPNPLTGEVSYSLQIPVWVWPTAIGAFLLAFVMFFKPATARFIAPLYALGYGGVVGAISKMYELQFDGIVLQAIGATFAVFAVMLFLYATRIIKVTQKYVIGVVAALGGIFLLYMMSAVASLFGASITFWNEPTPLGIGISVIIVVVAAMALAIDFAFIEDQTRAGAPKYMEWYGAYGLLVGLIFLYLQILRLIALVNSR